ncbi:hypothetical protein F5X97DRAFT_272518 [Nemania serpens]|nr:hypothetical protein F5X97DRAFT_272518 [Nemania serpens]
MAGIQYRSGYSVCSESCPIHHIRLGLVDRIKEPSNSWPDIRGLHSLNYKRDTWLTADAIEVSIKMYVSGLPHTIQNKIWVGTPGVDPRIWHRGVGGDNALEQALKTSARLAFKLLKSTEYSILPICTEGNHWVLVVVHKNQRPGGATGGDKEWSHVAQVAVLDPFRSAARTRMVHDRLRSWFEKAGRFTFAAEYQKNVWVPRQRDSTSCGPRAYWAAKQILDRLLVFYESHIEDDARLWAALSGWFDEGFVRAEMMGRCAWAGVRAMDYRARISIECVNKVRDTDAPNRPLIDAGEAMKPVEDKRAQPETRPPSRSQHIQPVPPTVTVAPEDSLGGRATVPQPLPRSLLPIPNQHRVAPGVRPAQPNMATESDDDRGPAWAPRPSAPGPSAPGPANRGVPGSSSNPIKVSAPSSSRVNTTPAPRPTTTNTAPTRPIGTTAAPRPTTNAAPNRPTSTTAAPRPTTTSTAPTRPTGTTTAPRPATYAGQNPTPYAPLNHPTNTTAAPRPTTYVGPNRPTNTTAIPRPTTHAAPNPPINTSAAPRPTTYVRPNHPTNTTAIPRPTTYAGPNPTTYAPLNHPTNRTAAPRPATYVRPNPLANTTATPRPATYAAPNPAINTSAAPRPTTYAAPNPLARTAAPRPANTNAAPNPLARTAAPRPATANAALNRPANTVAAPRPTTANAAPNRPTSTKPTKPPLGKQAIAVNFSYPPTSTTAYLKTVFSPKGARKYDDLMWGPRRNNGSPKRKHVSWDDAPRPTKRR